jgi:hypothetical protein
MADKNNPAGTERQKNSDKTDVIAVLIISVSSFLLAATTVVLLSLKASEASKIAFTMLVPMVGTWMGTVIAYYFTSKNYQHASEVWGQSGEEKLKSIPVKQAMIPLANMDVVTLPPKSNGKDFGFQKELLDRFKGRISRLPVLDSSGVAKYIIHESQAFEFVTEMAKGQSSLSLASLDLKQFLDFGENEKFVSRTMAFVAIDRTLADAKTAMEAVNDCQDVFVTEDGSRDKPVLGWIMNVDIAKRAKV